MLPRRSQQSCNRLCKRLASLSSFSLTLSGSGSSHDGGEPATQEVGPHGAMPFNLKLTLAAADSLGNVCKKLGKTLLVLLKSEASVRKQGIK